MDDHWKLAAQFLAAGRERIERAKRTAYATNDLNGTRAAIALDVHAVGCDDIPPQVRFRIASLVEDKLRDIADRRVT